ncbi:MAG: hypothetical protein HC939_00410 [Pleurocapsa sp. SU_5_0]|nr:hypothetical protein [Pleurocapsa sp. SU_5_0]NJR44663.1 hypothetical protein [Hyellaceae cyanobacterium CSU_1_1]
MRDIQEVIAAIPNDVNQLISEEDYQKQKASILELIGKEVQLRSKRDLYYQQVR